MRLQLDGGLTHKRELFLALTAFAARGLTSARPFEASLLLGIEENAPGIFFVGVCREHDCGDAPPSTKAEIRTKYPYIVHLPMSTCAVLRETLKSDSSYRTFEVSPSTIAAIRALVGQKKHGCGDSRSVALLFTDEDGQAISRGYVAATGRCLHYQCNRRWGHSKPSVTLDKYSDCIPSDQANLAARFEATVEFVYQGNQNRIRSRNQFRKEQAA